jgi:hypothetical protein
VQQQRAQARTRACEIIQRAGCSEADYDRTLEIVRTHARVVIHFHPDRLNRQLIPVADALLADGVYRNQFETGLSTGGLFSSTGSPRDTWERELFGGAYHGDRVTDAERPKYGALELVRFADGPIPRFGSCYFVLRPAVSSRTSFTFAGSEDPRAPDRLGTIDDLSAVMAALFAEIESGAFASPPWPPFRAPTLGVAGLTIPRVLDLALNLSTPRPDPAGLPTGRVLDTQIEAQVHGSIALGEDAEWLVADPAFERNATGDLLREISSRYYLPLRWHKGFRLPVDDVPADFRGPETMRLAQRIAGADGIIDAAVIGAAEATLHRQPETWSNWGSHADALQHLKQLWHVVVHYG